VIARRAAAVDPTAIAVAMATAYVEIRSGRRCAAQLEPYLTSAVSSRLESLVKRHRGRGAPSGGLSVRRVVTCRPSDDVAEVSVVIRDGHRCLAVAVRLEWRRRWMVTVLDAPEDRPPRGISRRRGSA
jgi:hypothetical protein